MSGRNYLCRVGILSVLLTGGCSTPLTGTPLDLTPFGAILSAIGVVYWLLAAGALWLAVAYSPTRRRKVIAGLIVAVVFGYFPLTHYRQEYLALEAVKTRLAKADAMFQERCKTAGEKILRTAENVEGVFLMKVRPQGVGYDEQFKMDDPYGHDSVGDAYIKSFLRGYHDHSSPDIPGAPPRLGYLYVEAVEPKDGKRYRYTGSIREITRTTSILTGGDGKTTFKTKEFVIDKVLAPGAAPRYGVTYDDLSTREEREYWIAGSSLKVVDLQTKEVMAERIGYMVDRGQGATGTGGARSPWFAAADNACPTFQRNPFRPIPPGHGASAQANQTDDFVEKVLHVKQEK